MLNDIQPGVFINGRWRQGVGAPLTLVDPCTGAPAGRVSAASPGDVDIAVEAAFDAFHAWRSVPVVERGACLRRIADGIDASANTLIALQMRCNGKPRFEAELDVADAAATFRYYAEQCERGAVGISTAVTLPDPAFDGMLHYMPVGVCALIVPWNFPMVTTAWKLAPALAAGCTVVIKPSELTPLAEMALIGIVAAAGVPHGVVNLVSGDRHSGEALIAHKRIAKISFTGSTVAGQSVMRAAAARMQRVSLELGGKSAITVFDDADLDLAIDLAYGGGFFNAGQMCSATSRVLVHRAVYETFIERLSERAKEAVIGTPETSNVTMGPLISARQRARALDILQRGEAAGAQIVCGGTVPVSRNGFFMAPTVCANVTPHNPLWQEEIFAPVICVRSFETERQAIDMTNDSDYGLVSTVVTRDAVRADRVASACEVGTVWVNTPQIIFPQTGWGGTKLSGMGRELGLSGLRAYQEIKHVIRAV